MDTLEHLERQVANSISLGNHLEAAEYITLLAQHVAGTEAAKAQPAAAKVEEWAAVALRRIERMGYWPPTGEIAKHEWRCNRIGILVDAAESELNRRVAEATADKDKRIAEVTRERDEWERRWNERQAKVKEIHEECLSLATRCDKLESRVDESSALREQLAERDAEIERLKKRVIPEGWEMSASMVKRQDEVERLTKDNAKLREQLSEATKPVEDEEGMYGFFASDANGDSVFCVKHDKAMSLLQRERAARVDAEQRLAELREFVRTKIVGFHDVVPYPIERTPHLSELQFDQLLDAFLAEKGKVGA